MSWVKPRTQQPKAAQRQTGSAPKPIEEIVAAQRAAFETEKKQLPTLRRKLSRLESEAKKLSKRHQIHARRDAEAEAEKLRKEEEERKRQERLEELKTGPKSRKDVKGRDYNPLMANSEGMGGGGGRIGRVKPCPPGG